MKKTSYCLLLIAMLILITNCSKSEQETKTSNPFQIPAISSYQLVWNDEFDNTGLPLQSKWGYEEGLVRNNEKQYYTRERIENARVENGILTIQGRKENFSGANYTSASIITKNKASWKYGRIEVRAKLPAGSGSWPAFWMLNNEYPDFTPWPKCGEIDILEAVGKEPGNIYSTVHYGNLWPDAKNKGLYLNNNTTYSDYHTYSIEWSVDEIKFFMDSNNFFTFKKSDMLPGYTYPFDKPFYLLLNLAIGGSWGGGNPAFPPFGIDDSTFPQKLMIDYVRVYQKS